MTIYWNKIRRVSASLAVFCLWTAGVTALLTAPAQAYIDPGTGSMFLQMVVAALAGGIWTLKIYWQRLKTFFFPGPMKEQRTENENSPDPGQQE